MSTEVPAAPPSAQYAQGVQTPREQRQDRRDELRQARPGVIVSRAGQIRPSRRRASHRWAATSAIIGIAVLLGAVLVEQAAPGWIVGLVVGLTTMILVSLVSSSLR